PLYVFASVVRDHADLVSLPTRRSSDLERPQLVRHALGHGADGAVVVGREYHIGEHLCEARRESGEGRVLELGDEEHLERLCPIRDRKSTRLNSSHVKISYAVFCLKQKR